MSTERRNPRSVDIDLFPTERILRIINTEDALVANAVSAAVPNIAKTVDLGVEAIRAGGRILYVGAGTSGRIGALDAAECPSTFSAPPEWIEAVIAGGSKALVHALEGVFNSPLRSLGSSFGRVCSQRIQAHRRINSEQCLITFAPFRNSTTMN